MPWTVALFVVLMLTTASATAGSRLSELPRGRVLALVRRAVGRHRDACVLVLALRLVDARGPLRRRGRRHHHRQRDVGGDPVGPQLPARRPGPPRRGRRRGCRSAPRRAQAYDAIGRDAAREALLPTLDQTRSTGLVTLPGRVRRGAASAARRRSWPRSSSSSCWPASRLTMSSRCRPAVVVVTRLAARSLRPPRGGWQTAPAVTSKPPTPGPHGGCWSRGAAVGRVAVGLSP